MNAPTGPRGIHRRWTPPVRLDSSRPRDVRLTGGGRALAAFAAVLFAAAVGGGIALGVLSKRAVEETERLRVEGVETEAVILRLWRRGGESNEHRVAYSFSVSGRTYEGSIKTSAARWRRLVVGGRLGVRYAASNPALHRARGGRSPGVAAWAGPLVALVLAALGVLCLVPIFGQRRLLGEGRLVAARVTGHSKEHRTSHGGDAGRKFQYEFRVLSGATAKGESGPTKNPPPVGSALSVVYDPEAPESNAVYPLSLVRPG